MFLGITPEKSVLHRVTETYAIFMLWSLSKKKKENSIVRIKYPSQYRLAQKKSNPKQIVCHVKDRFTTFTVRKSYPNMIIK